MYHGGKPFGVQENEFSEKKKSCVFSLIADLHLKSSIMLEQAHLMLFLPGMRYPREGTASAVPASPKCYITLNFTFYLSECKLTCQSLIIYIRN